MNIFTVILECRWEVISILMFCLACYFTTDSFDRIWPDTDDRSVFDTAPAIESANWQEPMFRVVESVEELEARVGEAA